MKAIIMAGGEGRRLRPVTGSDIPKPLAPLAGRPLMEHIVLLLKKQGFTELCCTLRYRPRTIQNVFGDGSPWGVHMEYRVEEEALGTAGGVKNCKDFYGDESFLVVSGDAACDFDLRLLAQRHEESAAAVTMALYPHEAPLAYGLALTDEGGFIRGFVEKPGWERVVTDLVNTGIYVVSPRAMDYVPDGKPFDFARDLFPLLMERGEKLCGLPMEGYWCDIGDPESYYQCCLDALRGRLKLTPPPGSAPSPEKEKNTPPARALPYRVTVEAPSRARLMRELSYRLMEAGTDFQDGLRLQDEGGRVHISPLPDRAALSVEADSLPAARRYARLADSLRKELPTV